MQRVIKIFLIYLGVFIALFLLSELLLRLTPYKNKLLYSGTPQYYYSPSKELGYDISANFATATHRFTDDRYKIWSNELGCFDYPYNLEDDYIYLTGDSFTWGFAPFEDKWGSIIEQKTGIRVLKCGVAGYGTKQELIKASNTIHSMAKKPKLIILGYFENDINDDSNIYSRLVYDGELIKNPYPSSEYSYDELMSKIVDISAWGKKYCMWDKPENPSIQRLKCFLSKHSINYTLARSALKKIFSVDLLRGVGIVNNPPASFDSPAKDFKSHFENIRQFNHLAKSNSSNFVIILIPTVDSILSKVDPFVLFKSELDIEGINYLDLYSEFLKVENPEMYYWENDLHWNSLGNQFVGELVSKKIYSYFSAVK